MEPPALGRARESREQQARALLESHPDFPSTNVEIYESQQENKLAEKLESTKAASDERMQVVLSAVDARAKVYLRLVDNLPLQNAFTVALNYIARTAWTEATGHAFDPQLVQLLGDIGQKCWGAITTRTRHWENEGFKRLMPKSDESRAEPKTRQGYRTHIRAWMTKTRIERFSVAAKRLGVSESALKSIMSSKGKPRYGRETLARILEETGYKNPHDE